MERPDHLPLVAVSVLEGRPEQRVSVTRISIAVSLYTNSETASSIVIIFHSHKRTCSYQMTIKLILIYQLNLRKSVDHDDSEGPVSPCSIVSIASSKESVAR